MVIVEFTALVLLESFEGDIELSVDIFVEGFDFGKSFWFLF